MRKFNSIVIGSLLWITPPLSFIGVFLVIAYCWPFGPEPFFKETWIGFPKLIANIAVWLTIFAASIALWAWIEKHRQAAIEKTRVFGWYDTSPLLAVLRERVTIPPTRWRARHVFATMARRGSYFDPKRSAAMYDTGPVPPPPDGSWVHDEWMPRYVELGSINADERLKTLITSSAIPLVFPTFIRQGDVFCDGGLVDNVPVLPLVTTAPCDLIIVVSLDRDENCTFNRLCKRLDGLWTKLEIDAAKPDSESPLESQWDRASEIRSSFYTEESIKRRPSTLLKQIQMVYVIPKRRLKGLLNFALDSFHDLERLGYDDARSKFGIQLTEPEAEEVARDPARFGPLLERLTTALRSRQIDLRASLGAWSILVIR